MKFSIIIPTYNRASFIPQAIESVLGQTYTDWELLIVDDGSTDNTRNVVEIYKDKRIRYIYQQNSERSAARNCGINHASGEYICFLDSDDSYMNGYLDSLSFIINNNFNKDNLFIITGMLVSRGNKKQECYPSSIDTNYYHYFYKNSVPPSIVCLSKTLLKKHSFDIKVVVSEDTKLWVEIMRENPNVIFNKTIGINFFFHKDNTINVTKRNVYKERQQTLQLILKEDTYGNINRNFAKKVIDDCNFGIAQYYLNNNKETRAIFVLLKSLILCTSYRFREKLGSLRNVLIRYTL